ncbi:MAG: pilus assembly protein [Pseudomonadales bacterium]|jgi:type IV pilus assembly protein PilE|uniref:type IV pilin protein n=1 Tax=Halopseudomonas sp. TaxID=2901191 RepID=UPI000C8D47B3|nr:pilus assembly protein [Pseudomonadales bacterium]|tara:strand:+ start:670 stop:1068 length:399 start_codon:yes stop_codon:yes gene_type:complete
MKAPRGFSLLELLIALVVAGLLASLAYPSYLNHVRKAQRVEVSALLMENAQRLERLYASGGRYDQGAVTGLHGQSPVRGRAVYRLAVQRQAQTFVLTAVAEAGGIMAGDVCASYSLNQAGQRTPADALCWRR